MGSSIGPDPQSIFFHRPTAHTGWLAQRWDLMSGRRIRMLGTEDTWVLALPLPLAFYLVMHML